MKKKIYAILNNHDVSNPPIGRIELFETFDWDKINWDEFCFGAGYYLLKANNKDEATKTEILNISLIKCKQCEDSTNEVLAKLMKIADEWENEGLRQGVEKYKKTL